MKCRCRNCGRIYDEAKSTADWKGYCSQKCVHDKARRWGFKKRTAHGSDVRSFHSEYSVLKRHNEIGSVEAK